MPLLNSPYRTHVDCDFCHRDYVVLQCTLRNQHHYCSNQIIRDRVAKARANTNHKEAV